MRAAKELFRKYLRSRGQDVVPLCDSLPGHLSILFSDLAIDCVLDVGAHRGEYGAFLRALGYRGKIISFEPVSKNFEFLRRRADHDPDWAVRRIALGSEEATAKINVTRETTFSSFLSRSGYGLSYSGTDSETDYQEEIEIVPLDRELEDLGVRLVNPFLKTDTQGWDFEVLRGARRSLEIVKALQVETAIKPIYEGAWSYFDVIKFLNSKRFEITGMFPVNRDPRLRIVEFDCVMIRDSSLDQQSAEFTAKYGRG